MPETRLTRFEAVESRNCPACGGSMEGPIVKDMIYCKRCGLFKKQYILPAGAQRERHRDFMIASLGTREKAVEKIRLAYEEMSWFLSCIRIKGKLFDVGASGGFMMAVGRHVKGWNVDGNEISTKSIEWAKRIFGVDIRYGLLEELDVPREEYDLVIFWHTLEHTIDVEESLSKARSMLRDGGYIVVAVPRRDTPRHLEQHYIPEHNYEFSVMALESLLNKMGFVEYAIKTPDDALWTREINVIFRLSGRG